MRRQKRKKRAGNRVTVGAKASPSLPAFGDQITLSIVIPYFNNARYLRKLFNSIFAPLSLDEQQIVEVILVDDGSIERQGIEAKKCAPTLVWLTLDKQTRSKCSKELWFRCG